MGAGGIFKWINSTTFEWLRIAPPLRRYLDHKRRWLRTVAFAFDVITDKQRAFAHTTSDGTLPEGRGAEVTGDCRAELSASYLRGDHTGWV